MLLSQGLWTVLQSLESPVTEFGFCCFLTGSDCVKNKYNFLHFLKPFPNTGFLGRVFNFMQPKLAHILVTDLKVIEVVFYTFWFLIQWRYCYCAMILIPFQAPTAPIHSYLYCVSVVFCPAVPSPGIFLEHSDILFPLGPELHVLRKLLLHL